MRTETMFALGVTLVLVACGQPVELDPVAATADPVAEPADPALPETAAPSSDSISAPVSAEGDRDITPYTHTRGMKGGWTQELPDNSVRPDPLHPREAMLVARDALVAFKKRNTTPTVLLAGLDHHGTPIVATSPDPADVPPGTPHVILDLEATRGPVQHWFFCKETLDRCARESGTMSGCVEFATACTTAEPWDEGEECCPRQCLEDYAQRVAEAMEQEPTGSPAQISQEAWFATFEVDVPTCNASVIAIAQAAADANAAALATTPTEVGQ